jgi:hypothetical protein
MACNAGAGAVQILHDRDSSGSASLSSRPLFHFVVNLHAVHGLQVHFRHLLVKLDTFPCYGRLDDRFDVSAVILRGQRRVYHVGYPNNSITLLRPIDTPDIHPSTSVWCPFPLSSHRRRRTASPQCCRYDDAHEQV